ncbi:hypothetical protein [Nostoc cycadae]|uniref:Helix-turn-helix domain-containing protein n=1 Tax=Nostoc cycadae WK-1 TaxID=1861711 RepID=A0A2H6LR08_9NOSO|nr:hypothetical protein [Nostoc cycadae]GBE95663.1 helix-turn-helix domain-containing protein [Nostoc cycadae WK-1]
MSKKNPFAAIGDAARSANPTPQPQEQPQEVQPEPAPTVEPQPKTVSKGSAKVKSGKRSDPDYRQTTIYVHDKLHRKFLRHLEDTNFDGDFSDWVETKMRELVRE